MPTEQEYTTFAKNITDSFAKSIELSEALNKRQIDMQTEMNNSFQQFGERLDAIAASLTAPKHIEQKRTWNKGFAAVLGFFAIIGSWFNR